MKNTLDQLIRSYGEFIIRFRWSVLVALVLLTVFMISQLRFITLDTSNEGFFKDDDPAILVYNDFRAQFGRDDMILLLMQPKEVFNLSFLQTLQKIHTEVEENEEISPLLNEVNSLVNARQTKGEKGRLIVKDLMEDFPTTEAQLQEMKSFIMQSPLYKNLMISEDGKYTALLVETSAYSNLGSEKKNAEEGFDDFSLDIETKADTQMQPITEAENTMIVNVMNEIRKKYQTEDLKIWIGGSPVVTSFLKDSMRKDMMKMTVMAIILIAVVLFLLFRRFSGVVLPLLTVIFSLQYTIATMAMTGTALKMPTQILPSFLLAVSVGAAVHLMSMFYKDYVHDKGNKHDSILDAMGHSGLPIAMTSLTTAAGLLSFSTAEIAPIGDLGRFAAFGVMVSLFLTLTMIPCLLAILPSRPMKQFEDMQKANWVDRTLVWLGDVSYAKANTIVIAAGIIFLFTIGGISQLKFSHLIIEWFPSSSEIYQSTKIMDKEMKGSVSVEVVVTTKEKDGLYDPKIQQGLEELSAFIMTQKTGQGTHAFGKTMGLSTMLKEINQALNENDAAHYKVPIDRNMIAQEFLLFQNSGSDDLENTVDQNFTTTRLTAKAYWQDIIFYIEVLDNIEKEAARIFGPEVKVDLTGLNPLFAETMGMMMYTMATSYSIAALVITLLMILLIGRFRLGLLSMIPNLLPIMMTLGIMGWFGIRLDMFTLLIGSIAMGLVVDDTIHFFHNYQRYFEKYGDTKIAIEHTLQTAGRAMLVTTIVLSLGFWIFMLGSMNNVFNFGLLTGMTLVFAFFADVMLAPALITVTSRKKMQS